MTVYTSASISSKTLLKFKSDFNILWPNHDAHCWTKKSFLADPKRRRDRVIYHRGQEEEWKTPIRFVIVGHKQQERGWREGGWYQCHLIIWLAKMCNSWGDFFVFCPRQLMNELIIRYKIWIKYLAVHWPLDRGWGADQTRTWQWQWSGFNIKFIIIRIITKMSKEPVSFIGYLTFVNTQLGCYPRHTRTLSSQQMRSSCLVVVAY